MEGDFIHINEWLLPLSWFYGAGVGMRNAMFDVGLLKSKSYDVPVISVGNITVGGTGKTPHVECLIRLLKETCKVAVLSRGYKRKSRGYHLATMSTPMQEIGDEPYQIKHKFPDVAVAVDKSRTHGIERIISDPETCDTDVILLDDAFQHRYVKPGVNILLVDYHRLIIYDRLLPAGRMREPLSAKNRADIVIVTKCPRNLKPVDFRVLTKALNLYPYQRLFFTTFGYEQPRPLFGAPAITFDALGQCPHLMLVTGIGSPRHMEEDLRQMIGQTPITHLSFADHHNFRQKDVANINNVYDCLPQGTLVLTTEKDATRLTGVEQLSDAVKSHTHILPINVQFMLGQEPQFNQNIIGYVRKNSRNSILAKAKDDNKPKDGHRPGDRPRTISFRDN